MFANNFRFKYHKCRRHNRVESVLPWGIWFGCETMRMGSSVAKQHKINTNLQWCKWFSASFFRCRCRTEIHDFFFFLNLCFVTWWVLSFVLLSRNFIRAHVRHRHREGTERKLKKKRFFVTVSLLHWKFNKRKQMQLAIVATTLMEEKEYINGGADCWQVNKWRKKRCRNINDGYPKYIIKRSRNLASVCLPFLFFVLFVATFGATLMPLPPPPTSSCCHTHYYFHCFFLSPAFAIDCRNCGLGDDTILSFE